MAIVLSPSHLLRRANPRPAPCEHTGCTTPHNHAHVAAWNAGASLVYRSPRAPQYGKRLAFIPTWALNRPAIVFRNSPRRGHTKEVYLLQPGHAPRLFATLADALAAVDGCE